MGLTVFRCIFRSLFIIKEIRCTWYIKWIGLGKQAGNDFSIPYRYFKQVLVTFPSLTQDNKSSRVHISYAHFSILETFPQTHILPKSKLEPIVQGESFSSVSHSSWNKA